MLILVTTRPIMQACWFSLLQEYSILYELRLKMKVKIQTMLGDIVVRLYDETPIHRDNFLKLAKEGYYGLNNESKNTDYAWRHRSSPI